MVWFEEFLNDINEQTQKSLTKLQLLEEMDSFKERELKRTPLLERQYPDDLNGWAAPTARASARSNERPDFPGADLLLSFHDSEYPNVQSGVIDRLRSYLEQNLGKRLTPFERVLKKEMKRRNSGRGSQKFWDMNRHRLEEKYFGYYALFRATSDGELAVELLSLGPSEKLGPSGQPHPSMATLFWGCKRQIWTADLLANTTKLSGTAIRVSTDQVIEPVLFSLLRTGRKTRPRRGQPKLLLSGMVSGWIDANPSKIMCSRTAVVHLPKQPDVETGFNGFCSTSADATWLAFSEEVEGENWPYREKLLSFLQRTVDTVDKDDTRSQFSYSLNWPVL